MEKAAFGIPVGTVSEVLESPHGLHILQVESRTERSTKPLEEVRETLRRQLEESKYKVELQAFLDKARADAEWCVKPRYKELLSIPAPASCQSQ
jgi:parvulin-like peptidyl-prolyl isomerase